MTIFTLSQLKTLSRAHLLQLLEDLSARLTHLDPGTPARAEVLASIAAIHAEFARRDRIFRPHVRPPAP